MCAEQAGDCIELVRAVARHRIQYISLCVVAIIEQYNQECAR